MTTPNADAWLRKMAEMFYATLPDVVHTFREAANNPRASKRERRESAKLLAKAERLLAAVQAKGNAENLGLK